MDKRYIFGILWAFAALQACNLSSDEMRIMDAAEDLMESRPDSSLNLLESLDVGKLRGDEPKARYALLMSMALDKNWVDTTDFSVLAPAIDYYLDKGTPDQKRRTYYYQGRIYQNRGEDNDAMQSFLKAVEVEGEPADSMLLARALVAQGVLYKKQYETSEFVDKNLKAAEIYGSLGKTELELSCYANALNGEVMLKNRSRADSIMNICMKLWEKCPKGARYMHSRLLIYTINYGSESEIRQLLEQYKGMEKMTSSINMNLAYGYSKIGEGEVGLSYLKDVILASSTDSLKYFSVEADVWAVLGDYEKALESCMNYIQCLENFQQRLFNSKLMFAKEEHEIEVRYMSEIAEKDSTIIIVLIVAFALVLLVGWFYFFYRINKSRRLIEEYKNRQLLLERESLKEKHEILSLQRDKAALETERLRSEVDRLVEEKDSLNEMLRERDDMSLQSRAVVNKRLEMLNSFLASEITSNDVYARDIIDVIRNDKEKFLASTRAVFSAQYPRFVDYLKEHNLSDDEINCVCLYAMGLSGKEIGNYIQSKRVYNISSAIRKKLGIGEEEPNIGHYIKRIMNEM